MISEELAPYCQEGEQRAHLTGPDVVLEPMVAQSIAVVVHELATNAVKYGALSAADGNVRVGWRRPPNGGLVLRWEEFGGPSVRRPMRQGFGTRVVDRMIRDQLKGQVRFDWREEGLVCEIAIEDLPSTGCA